MERGKEERWICWKKKTFLEGKKEEIIWQIWKWKKKYAKTESEETNKEQTRKRKDASDHKGEENTGSSAYWGEKNTEHLLMHPRGKKGTKEKD